MITSLFVVIAALGQIGGAKQVVWPDCLLGASIVPKSLVAARIEKDILSRGFYFQVSNDNRTSVGIMKTDGFGKNGSSKDQRDSNLHTMSKGPEPSAETVAAWDWISAGVLKEWGSCEKLLKIGDFKAAESRLESDVVQYPSDFFIDGLLDLNFLRGDYSTATELSVEYFQMKSKAHLPSHNIEFIVRLALASSELGNSYPGQRDFLVDDVCRRNNSDYVASSLPEGSSAEDINELARLDVGETAYADGNYGLGIEILKPVVSRAPKDALAAILLAKCYTRNGFQYSNAISVLDRSIAVCSSEQAKDKLTYFRNLYQSSRSKVGDGHPVWVPVHYGQTEAENDSSISKY